MSGVEKILVATDFSEASLSAELAALDLAALLGAELHFLHVYKAPDDALTEGERLRKSIENVRKLWGKELFFKVVYHLSEGNAVARIVESAGSIQAGITVVGTHGAGLLRRMTGSVASGVAAKSRCPVLMVPPSARSLNAAKIVYATNYSEVETEGISYITGLFRKSEPEITILHVNKLGLFSRFEKQLMEVYRNEVEDMVPYRRFRFRLVNSATVTAGIRDFLKKEPADLLAITQDRLSVNMPDFSLTKDMSFITEVPMLVIPKRALDEGLAQHVTESEELSG